MKYTPPIIVTERIDDIIWRAEYNGVSCASINEHQAVEHIISVFNLETTPKILRRVVKYEEIPIEKML